MAHTPSEPTQLLLHRQHSILKNQLRRARPVPAGTHPGQGRLTLGAVCPSSFASLLPNLSLSLLHLYVPVASCSEHQDTPLQCWFLCTQIRGMPERFWQPSRGCWFPSHIRPKGQWLSFKPSLRVHYKRRLAFRFYWPKENPTMLGFLHGL